MREREEIYLKGLEQGMKDQRHIILKLIDEKIKHYQEKKSYTFMDRLVDGENIKLLEELKEELKK